MMPWDHAAVGYVVFSLFIHGVYRDSPTAKGAIIAVFASALPDLIDKPLAWQFGVFEGGRALGHSIFFAFPLSLAILALAYTRGEPKSGWAFAIGYLLHLPADVFQTYMTDDELSFDAVLWPFTVGGGPGESFSAGIVDILVKYVVYMSEGLASGDPFVLMLLGLAASTVLLWIYDGMPVARELYVRVRRKNRRQ